MENIEPYQFWFLIAAIAYTSYLFGRANARRSGGPSREERLMHANTAAERIFSSMSPSTLSDIDQLISNGKTIAAIKLIREISGVGLRDAKLAADFRKKQINI